MAIDFSLPAIEEARNEIDNEISKMEEKFRRACAEYNKVSAELTARIQICEKQIGQIEQDRQCAQQAFDGNRRKGEQAAKKVADLKRELENVKREIEEAKKEAASLSAEANSLSPPASTGDSQQDSQNKAAYDAEKANLAAGAARARNEANALETEKRRIEAEIKRLNELIKKINDNNSQLRTLMNELLGTKSNIMSHKSELISTKSRLFEARGGLESTYYHYGLIRLKDANECANKAYWHATQACSTLSFSGSSVDHLNIESPGGLRGSVVAMENVLSHMKWNLDTLRNQCGWFQHVQKDNISESVADKIKTAKISMENISEEIRKLAETVKSAADDLDAYLRSK